MASTIPKFVNKIFRSAGVIQRRASAVLTRELRFMTSSSSENKDLKRFNVLILGSSSSGKSTLFKQVIQLHGKGFDTGSLSSYRQIIFRNVLSSMYTLVKQYEQFFNINLDDIDNNNQTTTNSHIHGPLESLRLSRHSSTPTPNSSLGTPSVISQTSTSNTTPLTPLSLSASSMIRTTSTPTPSTTNTPLPSPCPDSPLTPSLRDSSPSSSYATTHFSFTFSPTPLTTKRSSNPHIIGQLNQSIYIRLHEIFISYIYVPKPIIRIIYEYAENRDIFASLKFFKNFKPQQLSDSSVNEEVAGHVIKLWADPGIQELWTLRHQYQLPDSSSYFFEHVSRIAQPDYIPTFDDIILCRSRTTGIVETEINIQSCPLRIIDVGGTRSERKKWVHCFENVSAVIYVADINAYNQSLYEDNSSNRLTEDLELFAKVCNTESFNHTHIFLFLNKHDLFKEKVLKYDLKDLFPDYTHGCHYTPAAQFLMNQFLAKNVTPSTRIYPYFTNCADSNNIKMVMNAVKDRITHEFCV